jgi:hypothetical protein
MCARQPRRYGIARAHPRRTRRPWTPQSRHRSLSQADSQFLPANRFTLHAEQGRSYAACAGWESARRELHSVLGVWRGPVLTDLAEAGAMWPEAGAAQDSHLVVVEEMFDFELACARHREVVAELESAARREPSRQHLAAQPTTDMNRKYI